jgi:endonuclease-3
MRAVPREFLRDAHHWLILHGRYVCVARKPRCGDCLISDLCEFPEKGISSDQQIRNLPDPVPP